jgi:hypothetical protein
VWNVEEGGSHESSENIFYILIEKNEEILMENV